MDAPRVPVMRLPRKCSIKRRVDFARVKTTGQSKAGRYVILSTLADAGLTYLMTGFITTRRVGKAHDRVLLRRQLRALVQAHAPGFADLRRFLITIARPGAARASFTELKADWLKQAKRLGLFPRPDDACDR